MTEFLLKSRGGKSFEITTLCICILNFLISKSLNCSFLFSKCNTAHFGKKVLHFQLQNTSCRIFKNVRVWKLRKFTLTHLHQNFREINDFTKEVTKELISRKKLVRVHTPHHCFCVKIKFYVLYHTLMVNCRARDTSLFP